MKNYNWLSWNYTYHCWKKLSWFLRPPFNFNGKFPCTLWSKTLCTSQWTLLHASLWHALYPPCDMHCIDNSGLFTMYVTRNFDVKNGILRPFSNRANLETEAQILGPSRLEKIRFMKWNIATFRSIPRISQGMSFYRPKFSRFS